MGMPSAPWSNAYADSMPDRAPAGPTMLYLLELMAEAIRPPQTAVMMPTTGAAPEATASETDIGIDTRATVKPDRQLSFTRERYWEVIDGRMVLGVV